MILDRFEGGFAIIEGADKQTMEVPRNQLPEAAQEGDVLRLVNGKYVLDRTETARRKKEIAQLAENLWED